MTRKTTLAICSFLLLLGGLGTAGAAGLATSASKVDAIARYADADSTRLQVRLDMADGWHVNAHPASLDFLVPTTITATRGGEPLPLTIAWPQGHDSGIELGGTSIKVYSDATVIPVRIDAPAQSAAQPTLKIRVQACSNKGLCLPPSTLSIQPSQA